MRTDKELFEQTNELAKKFASRMRNVVADGFDFSRDDIHPRANCFWDMACIAQEVLTETDMENVDLDEVRLAPVIDIKCIVKGCSNRKSEGEFVGELCLPCYNMLISGVVKYGRTFINDMQKKIDSVGED